MPELPLEIQVDELGGLLRDPAAASLRLIDCREEDEWQICRISGAELIPLSRFAAEAARKLAGSREEQVIVYCHHGMRSMNATRWLRQNGFPQARSLRGGIDHWACVMDPQMRRY